MPEAEAFYRRTGLNECGRDRAQDNLMYFEWYQRQPMSGEFEGETIEWDRDESEPEAWFNEWEDDDEL